MKAFDIKPLLETKKQINYFINKYPESDYAIDLKFKKIQLKINQRLKKCMLQYYISVQKWIPAINRLKNIVNKYDKTIFIEEALHNL